jgi:hypothetical protein
LNLHKKKNPKTSIFFSIFFNIENLAKFSEKKVEYTLENKFVKKNSQIFAGKIAKFVPKSNDAN